MLVFVPGQSVVLLAEIEERSEEFTFTVAVAIPLHPMEFVTKTE